MLHKTPAAWVLSNFTLLSVMYWRDHISHLTQVLRLTADGVWINKGNMLRTVEDSFLVRLQDKELNLYTFNQENLTYAYLIKSRKSLVALLYR